MDRKARWRGRDFRPKGVGTILPRGSLPWPTTQNARKPGSWRPQTMMVRGGQTRSQHGETSEALFLTSGFVYDSPEQPRRPHGGRRRRLHLFALCEPHGAHVRGAAGRSSKAQRIAAPPPAAWPRSTPCWSRRCKPGDRIVAPRALFSSVVWILKNVMPKMGVEVTWVDGSDIGQWEKALKKPARFSIIETPSNPLLDAVDMRAVADLTHRAGGELIVDNVFASPILQKPLQFGADWVVYSTTKHMDGQGRTLGGAILGKTKAIEDHIQQHYRHTGPSMSPFNAWVRAEGPRDAWTFACAQMSDNARDRRGPAGDASGDRGGALSGTVGPSAPQHPRRADAGRRRQRSSRSRSRAGGKAAFCDAQRASADRHLEQSWRLRSR